MKQEETTRRSLLKGGGAALAGSTILQLAGSTAAFAQLGGEVIPWLDQPSPNPAPAALGNLLNWEGLNSVVTPTNNFFSVNHYGRPDGLNDATWRVDISGLVARPRTLTIADIKARPRSEVDYTLECSGNSAFPFFIGGIGNARWGGTRLAPLLQSADPLREASEVIFWGADSGRVTIRDNSGITSGGQSGTVEPDTTGGQDLTITEQFARSMSIREALSRDNLLCYEMNGDPLPPENGYPLRLIAPGWYGIANAKWLKRIEIRDRRLESLLMGRDYVTLRKEEHNGETVWAETSVGRARLKSAPARVTQLGSDYRIIGVAWGAPIDRVEVKVDDGEWMPATIDHTEEAEHAWKIWSLDWPSPSAGEHTVTSRAINTSGAIQPAMDDPIIANKQTYWESNGQVTRRISVG